MEYQVGVGGAGAEAVLATFPWKCSNAGGFSMWDSDPLALSYEVAAGTRIAYRCRKNSSGSAINWLMAMGYFEVTA
jgi:hypothetical protein